MQPIPQQHDLEVQKLFVTAVYKFLSIVGGILVALGSTIAFFLKRYWDNRDHAMDRREQELDRDTDRRQRELDRDMERRERELDRRERELTAKDAERAKMRDILYESLKWFEGGTQRRSIGIAVVNSSWDTFAQFQPLWIEVFANQAIYLLIASESKTKAHEHDNLTRIMDVLLREKQMLSHHIKACLIQSIKDKQNGSVTTGLALTEDMGKLLTQWLASLLAEE